MSYFVNMADYIISTPDIECDQFGLPINTDPAQFQVTYDDNNTCNDNYSTYITERKKMDEKFGIESNNTA